MQAAQCLGARGVHIGRGRFVRRPAQRMDLNRNQRRRERNDKSHHRQRDRGSECEHAAGGTTRDI